MRLLKPYWAWCVPSCHCNGRARHAPSVPCTFLRPQPSPSHAVSTSFIPKRPCILEPPGLLACSAQCSLSAVTQQRCVMPMHALPRPCHATDAPHANACRSAGATHCRQRSCSSAARCRRSCSQAAAPSMRPSYLTSATSRNLMHMRPSWRLAASSQRWTRSSARWGWPCSGSAASATCCCLQRAVLSEPCCD